MNLEGHARRALLAGLLRRTLDAYDEGRIGLRQLADDSESLIDTLDGLADSTWVARLRELQSPIEVTYAVADAEERAPDAEELEDVSRAVEELRTALDELPVTRSPDP